MDRELFPLLFLVAATLGLVAAIAGRGLFFALLPLLVTLNGISIPTPVAAVRFDQAAGVLIAIAIVARQLVRPRPLVFDRTMGWMLAFLALSVYSSLFASPDRRYSLVQTVNYFSAIWIYAVVLLCTDSVEDVDRVTDRFLTAGIVGAVVGIAAFVLGISGVPVGGANVDVTVQGLAFGSYGTMREPNIYANFCQIFFVYGVAVLQLQTREARALSTGRLTLLLLTSSIGLVLGFTRGAWIASFAGIVGVTIANVMVFGARVRISRILVPVLTAVVAGAVIWTLSEGAQEFMRDKLLNLVNPKSENAAVRLLFYGRALTNFQQRPWLGWGTFSFAPLSVTGIDVRLMGNRHDFWLGSWPILALHDTGIVGLVIFVGILLSVLRPAVRVARDWARTDRVHAVRVTALGVAFSSLLVSFLTSSGFTFGYPWLLLGIIGAYVRFGRRAVAHPDDVVIEPA